MTNAFAASVVGELLLLLCHHLLNYLAVQECNIQLCVIVYHANRTSNSQTNAQELLDRTSLSLRHSAIIAVKTGMVGCIQVATSTPDNEMPMMYISWLKKRHTPRALTCSQSEHFGSTPANTL